MPTTSRVLFADIIDYAGLFPPAKLPMDEAFQRFLHHRSSDSGWLLARFVCPASHLDELAPLMEAIEPEQPLIRVAVLGAGGDDPPSFSGSLEHDVESMMAFSDRLGKRALIDVFEVKLPGRGDPSEVVDLVFHNLEDLGSPPPRPFFEIPLIGEIQDPGAGASAVAAAGHEIDPNRRAGLKIRCGGLDAAAVPTVDSVAGAVTASLAAGLPLKATQGLHHPVRHHDPELGTTVHGFVNLVSAMVLAQTHGLGEITVREIIAEEDGAAFALTETAIGWRGFRAGTAVIANGRSDVFTGFGSCSFSEPRDDLAALGWI